jgi:hypothetical protein
MSLFLSIHPVSHRSTVDTMAGIPPADIYARLLIPVDSTRGYPLWLPEPQDRLPEAYRDEGIRIGDVGIVTERGQFDILFNICLPRDHPINQRHGVPATFKQVELLFHDVCQFSHADPERSQEKRRSWYY